MPQVNNFNYLAHPCLSKIIKENFLSEQVDRCRLKTNVDEINWFNESFFRYILCSFVHFVQYFYALESWPLADYVLRTSICALILNF